MKNSFKRCSGLFLGLITLFGTVATPVEATSWSNTQKAGKASAKKAWTQNVFLALIVTTTPFGATVIRDSNAAIQKQYPLYKPYASYSESSCTAHKPYHVTMVEIGAVTDENQKKVISSVDKHIQSLKNKTKVRKAIRSMHVESADLFGSKKKFPVLKFESKHEVTALSKGLKDALVRGNIHVNHDNGTTGLFKPSSQEFTPHVSIGSCESPMDKGSIQNIITRYWQQWRPLVGAIRAEPRLVLYTTIKGGAYKELASWNI